MPVSLPTCDHHYELNDRRRPDQRPGTSGTARLGARPGRLQRRLAPGPGPRRLGPHALSESITSSVRSDYVEAPEVQELLDLVTSVRSRLSNGGGGPRRSQAGLLAPGPGAGAAPGSTLIRAMNIGIGCRTVPASRLRARRPPRGRSRRPTEARPLRVRAYHDSAGDGSRGVSRCDNTFHHPRRAGQRPSPGRPADEELMGRGADVRRASRRSESRRSPPHQRLRLPLHGSRAP